MKKTEHVCFFPKWVKIVVGISDEKSETFPLKLSRKYNVTYSHITKIIQSLEKKNIITTQRGIKNARTKFVYLTEKGKTIAEHLKQIELCIR